MAVVDEKGGNEGDFQAAGMFGFLDAKNDQLVESHFGRGVDGVRRLRRGLPLGQKWKQGTLPKEK